MSYGILSKNAFVLGGYVLGDFAIGDSVLDSGPSSGKQNNNFRCLISSTELNSNKNSHMSPSPISPFYPITNVNFNQELVKDFRFIGLYDGRQ